VTQTEFLTNHQSKRPKSNFKMKNLTIIMSGDKKINCIASEKRRTLRQDRHQLSYIGRQLPHWCFHLYEL